MSAIFNKYIIGLTAAIGASSAGATTLVDPDAFSNGTDISNAFAGVTLQTVFTGADVNDILSVGSVFSVTDSNASTGTQVFGQSASNPTWGNGSFEYLLATFDSTVFSVSLDFFANDSSDMNAQLLAFDTGGSLIFSDSVTNVTFGTPQTLTVSGGGIASIRAYWDEINRSENGGLDNLVFVGGAVPEPGTWALMLLGFFGIGGAMRASRARQRISVSFS